MRETGVWFMTVAVIVAATGCSGATQSESATPTIAPPTASMPADIAVAIEFRTKLGIRADEDLVRELATDPTAVARGERSGYGVPLTEAELVVLQSRIGDLRDIAAAGHAYGVLHPEDFAGDYIDQENHRYVFLVTSDVEKHRAGLLAALPFGSPVSVEIVKTSLGDLEVLRERVRRDEAWFASIGARYIGLSVLEQDNVVEVTVGSDDAAIEGRILEHFGNTPMLRVRTIPGGVPQDGYGRVIIRIVDVDGQPITPRNVRCQVAHEVDRGWTAEELGPISSQCQYSRVPAGRVDGRIIRDGGDRRVLAHEGGVVTAGEATTITVTFRD